MISVISTCPQTVAAGNHKAPIAAPLNNSQPMRRLIMTTLLAAREITGQ
jgi:hypothetical protein